MIRDLISGVRSRIEVTEWAMQWLDASDPGVDDPVVWKALGQIVGADAPTTDRPWLYGQADFQAWISELEGEPNVE